MNKSDLIKKIAEKTGFAEKDADKAVDAVIETISGTLEKGNKVQIIGFGTFEVRERKARQGRNPQNPGVTMVIPAAKAPVFKAGKTLKYIVNK